MTNTSRKTTIRTSRLALTALAILIGAGAVYVMTPAMRNAGTASCAASADTLARMKPLARGEVAAVIVPDAPRALPVLAFQDGEGRQMSLADFKGRTVLLNLWATWCAPCREEMPALDRLQGEMGGKEFEVLAVSLDTGSGATDRAKRFLDEVKADRLAFRADPSGGVFRELKAVGRIVGLPTSILIDAAGCEIGYLPGPADWASPDALSLVKASLGER